MTHWTQKPPEERTIHRFSEALSEHGKVAKAARSIGITPTYGQTLLKRIKAKLGVEQCR